MQWGRLLIQPVDTHFETMEPDSTTVEQDSESVDLSNSDRESLLVQELSSNCDYFQQNLIPLMKSGCNAQLISWMKQNGLLMSNAKCSKECSNSSMKWAVSKVVDKYQWQCNLCHHKMNIRENSFFKSVYCSFSTALKLILAWCQDLDCENAANIFGVKKQIVISLFEKIERIVAMRPSLKLGGENSVILVELFPEFVDELYPVSSKSETSKMQHRILCIADTKFVPTQYWLHVITGSYAHPTENNNTQLKKVNLCEETLKVLETLSIPGGLCAIGGGVHLSGVLNALKDSSDYEGVTSMNNITLQTDSELLSFLSKSIWKPVIALCEAAQDLPKNKMQTYLSCALWRWQTEAQDTFYSLLQMIASHDYSTPINNRHRSKTS